MNKAQREELEKAKVIMEQVLEEEEEKLSNMEYNFSETERFQRMEEKRDELQEAVDSLDTCLEEY